MTDELKELNKFSEKNVKRSLKISQISINSLDESIKKRSIKLKGNSENLIEKSTLNNNLRQSLAQEDECQSDNSINKIDDEITINTSNGYITNNYLENIKSLASETLKTMDNDSVNAKSSFLDNFFNQRVLLDDMNPSTDKEAIQLNTDSFLDFIFSSSKLENNHSLNEKPQIGETNTQEKIKYLTNLKLNEHKNVLAAIKQYVKMVEIFTQESVQKYLNQRVDSACQCIRNALGCCLENLHTQQNRENRFLLDKCCAKCAEFNFKHSFNDNEYFDLAEAKVSGRYLLLGDVKNNKAFNHINCEEKSKPKWFIYFNDMKITNRLEFISNTLRASNLLRDACVQKFFSKHAANCDCLNLSNPFKCCIEKMYSILHDLDNLDLKFFDNLENNYCCLSCQGGGNKTEDEIPATNNDHDAQEARNAFKLKKSSSDSSNKDSFDNQVNLIQSESNISIESLDDFFNNMNVSTKSKNNSIGKNKVTEKHQEVFTAGEDTKMNSNSKSVLKKSKYNTPSVKKRKNVTFYLDPKYGFVPLEIPEWQENLREPVYSASTKVTNPEWRMEPTKNEYDFTKSLRENTF